MAVTVYAWGPTAKHPGHASIDLNGRYYSFGVVAIGLDLASGTPSAIGRSFDKEKAAFSGHSLYTTRLERLDEDAVGSFLQHLIASMPPYRLAAFNCTHPVKIALYEGTGRRIEPDFTIALDPARYTTQVPPLLQPVVTEGLKREMQLAWNPLSLHRYAEQIRRVLGG